MKRLMVLMLALLISGSLYAREEGFHGGGDSGGADNSHHDEQSGGGGNGGSHASESHESRSSTPKTQTKAQRSPRSARTTSGSRTNSNSGQPGRKSASGPAYRNNSNNSSHASSQGNMQARGQQSHAKTSISRDSNHRAFTPAKAQARLHSLGISKMPERINDRKQLLVSSREQSVIRMPHTGLGGHAIAGVAIGAHEWNGATVRTQMGLVGGAHISTFNHLNLTETRPNHYYWHHDGGYDYCHYYDPYGYHWYGWYVGSSYFWTRYYSDRWWFYDNSYDRWCYWNGGYWWWQNPYNMGAVYVYDNGQYVPSNDDAQAEPETDAAPADDEPAANGPSAYRSDDDTRMVKIMGDSQDAFLYDTAIPPAFSPLYLASKVSNVKFSDTSNGKPLQIMVTLSDGSFDIFDAQGESMNFSDAKPDNEGMAPNSRPGNGSAPPGN